MNCARSILMRLPYWTKTPGTGGILKSEEDFIVKEIIHRKYFAKYRTAGKVSREPGKYNLFLLRKRNMTTHEALELLRKRFGSGKIGFAGLKDKKAVTEQYVTMEGGGEFKDENISLTKIGTTDKFLSKGDLLGNEFIITLHGCNTELLPSAAKEINKKGVPNYFGPQRFGVSSNNHVIGRLIVKREFRKALGMINRNHGKKYGDISGVPKQLIKFFINAYQSWIFNELLGNCVKKNKKLSGYLPVIGFNTGAAKNLPVLKKEKTRAKDFMVSELRLACSGSKRKAFIKTYLKYTINDSSCVLKFALPAGSYATVVLREITKKEVR